MSGNDSAPIETGRRRFLALLLSPALLPLVGPLKCLAGDEGGAAKSDSPWLEACAPLGKVRAQTLAVLAADLLPADALKLPDDTLKKLAAAEAAHIGAVLAGDARIPDWYNQQLDALNDKVAAMWQDLTPEKRKAWLDKFFAAADPAANEDQTAAHFTLQTYLLRLRNDLELAFWEFPALSQRVTELADVKR